MKSLTRKIGDWAAFILMAVGAGMFIWPFGNRHRTAREWVQETGIDLSIWLGLAVVFLVGGLCLLAVTKLPDRKD
ncbi:hypothetical protein [Caulobacter sp. BK020]|uniref:hypothetical protein n=1 Tax=Caulobacter sp. BK020 TaxID=2512117 RepID=UPI00104BC266|nr:hypothetical protein [Caulobacter sp. BK020]